MSKLSEMIQAKQTSERRHVMAPMPALVDIDYSCTALPGDPLHYVYEMNVTLGCQAVIRQGSGDADVKLKVIRRQVVEAIFGEFREDIYTIERALMNYDTDKAAQAVSDLYRRMFDV